MAKEDLVRRGHETAGRPEPSSHGTLSPHTPGEWWLNPLSYGYDLCIRGTNGMTYGGWFIELHHGLFADDKPELAETFEANCRLIVAAPDMLSALSHMLDLYGHDWPTPEHAVACDEARTAISKATGSAS